MVNKKKVKLLQCGKTRQDIVSAKANEVFVAVAHQAFYSGTET